MRSRFRLSTLIPPGLAAEQVCETAEVIVVTARPLADGAACPDRVPWRGVTSALAVSSGQGREWISSPQRAG